MRVCLVILVLFVMAYAGKMLEPRADADGDCEKKLVIAEGVEAQHKLLCKALTELCYRLTSEDFVCKEPFASLLLSLRKSFC